MKRLRVARSGADVAEQLFALVRLSGGDPALLPSLLRQVEAETGRGFNATCIASAQTLAHNLALSRADTRAELLLQHESWTVAQLRIFATVSRGFLVALRRATHVADFFALNGDRVTVQKESNSDADEEISQEGCPGDILFSEAKPFRCEPPAYHLVHEIASSCILKCISRWQNWSYLSELDPVRTVAQQNATEALHPQHLGRDCRNTNPQTFAAGLWRLCDKNEDPLAE